MLGWKIEVQAAGSRARAGRFRTLHGEILTPLFMPVGTQATVRNVGVDALAGSGSQMLLANTYHLFLRPGREVFEKFGGIHRFMNWSGSVLTDSGGFQVFSLPGSRRVTEEGAAFKSYVDGREHLLSPEASIGMQRAIGSDIMMAMDVCIPSTSGHAETRAAMQRTHRWALRSLEARGDSKQALFGIVQGACHRDLREESARFISSLPFDGLAIGGLAVGESKEERETYTEIVTDLLPPDRPRYLMGVGTPIDLLEAVHRGVDMFDCVIPTKLSEQGVVYTSEGRIQLIRGVYKLDESPLDPACACPTCRHYSKAYLHHLVKACEPLSTQLLGAHNIWFYHSLMRDIRAAILEGRFKALYRERREKLDLRDAARDHEGAEPTPKVGRRPKRRPDRLGAYELVDASAPINGRPGLASIRHIASGEIMHPGPDPMREARDLYLGQSRLLARLEGRPATDELVVWDVGLGGGFNAMAVVSALAPRERPAASSERARVRLVSFERDLDPLRLALHFPDRFPHVRHPAPHALLDTGRFEAPSIVWELVEGDFLETLTQAAAPDLVFFDPFSSKIDGPLWSDEAFSKLYACVGGRACRIFNYTASTQVRARLLKAGFWVARGEASPPKDETTVALTPAALGEYPLLDETFLGRAERSSLPGLEWLRNHAQFAARGSGDSA